MTIEGKIREIMLSEELSDSEKLDQLHALIPPDAFKIDNLNQATPAQLKQLKDGLAVTEATQQIRRRLEVSFESIERVVVERRVRRHMGRRPPPDSLNVDRLRLSQVIHQQTRMINNMKIVVIGGSGLIGTKLVNNLRQHGQ